MKRRQLVVITIREGAWFARTLSLEVTVTVKPGTACSRRCSGGCCKENVERRTKPSRATLDGRGRPATGGREKMESMPERDGRKPRLRLAGYGWARGRWICALVAIVKAAAMKREGGWVSGEGRRRRAR